MKIVRDNLNFSLVFQEYDFYCSILYQILSYDKDNLEANLYFCIIKMIDDYKLQSKDIDAFKTYTTELKEVLQLFPIEIQNKYTSIYKQYIENITGEKVLTNNFLEICDLYYKLDFKMQMYNSLNNDINILNKRIMFFNN